MITFLIADPRMREKRTRANLRRGVRAPPLFVWLVRSLHTGLYSSISALRRRGSSNSYRDRTLTGIELLQGSISYRDCVEIFVTLKSIRVLWGECVMFKDIRVL